MGLGTSSSLPPFRERDLRRLLSYNLSEKHLNRMWRKFIEVDSDRNRVWTVAEIYDLIQEPRMSMRAPIIDAIFFFGDGQSEGAINFEDYAVTFTSFCALSTEEIVQLLFIVMDKDRNGYIDKEELLEYFSYVPLGCGDNSHPIFPVNNKNALDNFRGGKWTSLEFDGLAQLCERFPYIPYPAYHAQELYRQKILGKKFWERLDRDRAKYAGIPRVRRLTLPGTKDTILVKLPGRCTMQELLEYSRRKTSVHAGKRVASNSTGEAASTATKERDAEIETCPLLTMIRNPRCMYYVPPVVDAPSAPNQRGRPELELAPAIPPPDTGGGNPQGTPSGIRFVQQSQNMALELEGGLQEDADEGEEDEESESTESESEEEPGGAGAVRPPAALPPPPPLPRLTAPPA